MYGSKKNYKIWCVSTFSGTIVRFFVVPTLFWRRRQRGDADAFVVSLAVNSGDLFDLSEDNSISRHGWTEIAHSDHNPVDGHDIYDSSDPKQFHIDVNDPTGDKYTRVYRKIERGDPPRPVGTAADLAKRILEQRRKRFLSDYLDALE
ncbi:MAG: hypothetical protein ABEI99_08110 [Halobaculum sp.]